MTAYIANHEKKNRIFAKRERELVHAIKHAYSAEKLFIVAEKLRAAKIAVFKCRWALDNTCMPRRFAVEEEAAHDPQVKRWLSYTAADIVELYRPAERDDPSVS